MILLEGHTELVIIPGVGVESVVEVILVHTAVPAVGAARRHQFHLRARRVVKVGRLVRRIDLGFLDAVRGGRHNSAGRPIQCAVGGGDAGWITRKGGGTRVIDAVVAVHIAGVVAAVQQIGVVVVIGPSHAAVRAHAGLQGREGGHIMAEAGQRLDRFHADRLADGCIQSLQFSATHLDFNGLGCRPDVELHVRGGLRSHADGQAAHFCGREAGFDNRDFVDAGRHVGEDVLSGAVGGCGQLGASGRIDERHGRVRNDGAALVLDFANDRACICCLTKSRVRACKTTEQRGYHRDDPLQPELLHHKLLH